MITSLDKDFINAVQLVINKGVASCAFLQQELSFDCPKALRIIDEMERLGILAGAGSKTPRKVVITESEWQNQLKKNKNGD